MIKCGTETSILLHCGYKRGFDVCWLSEDVLPLLGLINLYDERQRGEELLTAPLFFFLRLHTDKSVRSLSTHTYTYIGRD